MWLISVQLGPVQASGGRTGPRWTDTASATTMAAAAAAAETAAAAAAAAETAAAAATI